MNDRVTALEGSSVTGRDAVSVASLERDPVVGREGSRGDRPGEEVIGDGV